MCVVFGPQPFPIIVILFTNFLVTILHLKPLRAALRCMPRYVHAPHLWILSHSPMCTYVRGLTLRNLVMLMLHFLVTTPVIVGSANVDHVGPMQVAASAVMLRTATTANQEVLVLKAVVIARSVALITLSIHQFTIDCQ
jgi:hypothetical protein